MTNEALASDPKGLYDKFFISPFDEFMELQHEEEEETKKWKESEDEELPNLEAQ